MHDDIGAGGGGNRGQRALAEEATCGDDEDRKRREVETQSRR